MLVYQRVSNFSWDLYGIKIWTIDKQQFSLGDMMWANLEQLCGSP